MEVPTNNTLPEIPETHQDNPLKTLLRFLAVFSVAAATTAHAQTWLLNFNNDTGFRGASQNGTDTNGNLWNNLNPWYGQQIQTVFGTNTGSFAGNILSTAANIDSYGGPAGTSVTNPLTQAEIDGVVIDSAALGLLGGSKAAAAGYVVANITPTWNFQITTLNTNLTYDATFYGARTNGGTSVYSAYTDGNYTAQSQSTTLNVGGVGTYNTNTVATMTALKSDASNNLNLQLSGSGGPTDYGYLNSMELYGYIGYLNGSTTTNVDAPAAGYVANGNYTVGVSRSVDTVIGGGSTLNTYTANGIYYNSTLVMRAGGGTINTYGAASVYALTGSGNLTVGGNSTFSITHSGTYSGTLTLNGSLTLAAASGLGTGNLVLNGGTLGVGNATALGTGAITVASGTTTLNNYNGLTALTGNNPINLTGGGTFQVNGYSQILNLGTGNVTVTGNNNLNAYNGGMQLDGVISGSGLLNWYGGGSLTLGAANTFTGTVAASGNNGTLVLANVNALQNATLNMGHSQTLSFGVSGNNTYNVGALASSNSTATIALGSNAINAGGNNGNSTYSGTLTGTGGGLTKSGSGVLTLGGNNTYGGGTTLTSGTLVLAHTNAAGAAGIALTGATSSTLQINAGITIANNIIFSNTNASVSRLVGTGTGYSVGTSGSFTSNFSGGQPDTTASIRAGTASSNATLTMKFASTPVVTPTNDAGRISDVFSLTGTATNDVFVLQLNVTGLTTSDFLGWVNGSTSWANAVTGNTGSPGSLAGAYTTSYDTFLATYGGSFNATTMLGAYGVDTTGGSVWAVVNHNSEFAAVPEPSTWVLLAVSLTTVMVLRRRS